jgi:hypothetical protein
MDPEDTSTSDVDVSMSALHGSASSGSRSLSKRSLHANSSLGSLLSNASPSDRRVQKPRANHSITEDVRGREGTFDPDLNPPQLPSSPGSCDQDSQFYEDSCDMHFEFISSGTHNDNYLRTHSTPSSGQRTDANVTADDELEVIQTILPDVEIFSDSEWETDFEDIFVRPKSFKALVEFHTVCVQVYFIYYEF